MKYGVTVPIAGFAYVEVEAESEEEAKQSALENVLIDNIEEWKPFESIASGNVLYAPQNNIEIEEII